MRADRPAQARADLGEVLRRRVIAGDARLLHAEPDEDVRRERVVGADLVDERAAEPAIDADVARAVDVVAALAELALDEQAAVAEAQAAEHADVARVVLAVAVRVRRADAAREQTDAKLRQLAGAGRTAAWTLGPPLRGATG